MAKNTGGPAFPHVPSQYSQGDQGMTLRDWFAGKALQGMLAHATRYHPRPGASGNWHEAIAEEAHQLADAMLAERDK